MPELLLTIIIFLVLVIPVGTYLYHITAWKKTFADPVMNRVDGVIYKISGVDPKKGMTWWQYAIALLITNAAMILIGYVILRIQSLPILNPNDIGSMEETLSFNTIISFMTNTNLQHYSGESGLSYLSQMLVITFMMFVSAGSGYAPESRHYGYIDYAAQIFFGGNGIMSRFKRHCIVNTGSHKNTSKKIIVIYYIKNNIFIINGKNQ